MPYYISKQTGQVILGAIGYTATPDYENQQVTFEETTPMYSCHTKFAFEKKNSINGSPGIWYLSELDSYPNHVCAGHLLGAYKYCLDHYGKNFEPFPQKP